MFHSGINDWASVAKKYKYDPPNLIDLLLSLPACSAEAERVFSRLKQVKNDIRFKLMDSGVSDLLTILPCHQAFRPNRGNPLFTPSKH
jgi:hypothetical protein